MTLTQRLTRAGLVFVLLGTVAALVPTNGVANAAQCTVAGVIDTLGTSPSDTSTSYSFTASGGSLVLGSFVGTTSADVKFFFDNSGGAFTNTIGGSAGSVGSVVSISATSAATETVTATFPNGQVVAVTVTAN